MMTRNKAGRFGWILLGLCALAVQSCSHIHTNYFPDPISPAAREEGRAILEAIRNTNRSLVRFKGIGAIEIQSGPTFTARAAWAGTAAGLFRIEILGIAGRPLISLAANRESITYLAHADSTYFRKSRSGMSLEKLTAIPITVEDIVALLTGRVPVREHADAYLAASDTGSGFTLILEKEWTGVRQKIYLDETKTRIYKVEIFGITGALEFRAVLRGTRNVDTYEVPSHLVLSNEDGASCALEIDRYLANPPVPESMFTIPPPGGAE